VITVFHPLILILDEIVVEEKTARIFAQQTENEPLDFVFDQLVLSNFIRQNLCDIITYQARRGIISLAELIVQTEGDVLVGRDSLKPTSSGSV
jgi:hypothetical protein